MAPKDYNERPDPNTRSPDDGEQGERHQSVPGKKDRKRFCRGKAGALHNLVCRKYGDVKQPGRPTSHTGIFEEWRILMCTVCGKELDWWMPYPPSWPSFAKQKPVPSWVIE